MTRTLLIRPGAIGDCLLALPVLEQLQTEYTEVWVPSVVVPLVQFADRVRSIPSTGLDIFGVADRIPAPSLVDTLGGFDRIVSWYGANRLEFVEAVRGIARQAEFHRALPPSECALHATDFFAQQVGAPLLLVPQVSVAEVQARNTVVFHPFSGSIRKNWPLEKFRELARALPCPVECCAGPEELLPQAKRFDDLLELASWLSGARLFVGNDSGITHLAAATGLPVVALFGPTDPKLWAPRNATVIASRSEQMRDLEVSQILPEILRLLA